MLINDGLHVKDWRSNSLNRTYLVAHWQTAFAMMDHALPTTKMGKW
jgi:hypothetical protein